MLDESANQKLPYVVLRFLRSPTSGAKREAGAPIGKSGAAPATVSGEPDAQRATGRKTGKAAFGNDP